MCLVYDGTSLISMGSSSRLSALSLQMASQVAALTLGSGIALWSAAEENCIPTGPGRSVRQSAGASLLAPPPTHCQGNFHPHSCPTGTHRQGFETTLWIVFLEEHQEQQNQSVHVMFLWTGELSMIDLADRVYTFTVDTLLRFVHVSCQHSKSGQRSKVKMQHCLPM